MTTAITEPVSTPIERMRWRIDPDRSSAEFEVATLWGLVTVAGRFESYDGALALMSTPAIELTIDADSLDTNHAVRDEHPRSAEFFDVENHPYVRFVSDSAALSGQRLRASGRLHAAGRSILLELEGWLRRAGDELEVRRGHVRRSPPARHAHLEPAGDAAHHQQADGSAGGS